MFSVVKLKFKQSSLSIEKFVQKQERIPDFWIGGSNSERGIRFPSFASFFLKFPMKMK